MNRSYLPEDQYRPQELPATRRGAAESILCFFDLLIAFLSEPAVRATARVFGAILCFFAFLFVIGAVETEAMTFGGGILLSLLLFAIAFFCVYRPKKGNT